VVAGTVFLLTFGRRLLPSNGKHARMTEKAQQLGTRLATLYEINQQLNLIQVLPGSPMANKTLAQGEWATRTGLIVVGVIRNGQTRLAPIGTDIIRTGDVVVVHGEPDKEKLETLRLHSDGLSSGLPAVMDETVVLAELVIAPHSSLIGRTLRDVNFREKYNVNVLAIWRSGKPVHTGIADLPLQFGDALLVQGPAARVHLLHEEPELILLEEDPDAVLQPGKAKWTIVISALTLISAAIGIIPVAQAVFGGAVLLLLIRALNMNDAYRGVEWRAIFLIAGMWPLSIAIRTTGLADMTVNFLLSWVGSGSGLIVAVLLLVVSLVLTQFMSGQVASLVLAPLALVAAEQIGVDPRAVGMAVALGCSLAFITPFGHPVNVMVMSPGGYTIRDFLRIGTPLTLIAIAVILAGLHFFWGLN
ncbi:MAG TPA: SLC13 family permease, partial [Anaerolineaceae bacterium]|nr:SLC13 family permease [Anaerolineaceae bacterium]